MEIEHLTNEVSNILSKADPIMLTQMDSVSLQNRIDRKYILHQSRLPGILQALKDDYYVLEIGEHRIFSYRTVYYDTPDFQFFKDHHNGLTNRIKVRCRQYVETNDTFFEIKRKYQGTRTDKYRKHIDGFFNSLGEEEYSAIKCRYQKHEINDLKLSLKNFFFRITLVSKKLTERATVDFGISFSNDTT
ncbi:MAG: polyphosphate polymerase domain-containing protein, partial [Sphingobacteriales bacterium]